MKGRGGLCCVFSLSDTEAMPTWSAGPWHGKIFLFMGWTCSPCSALGPESCSRLGKGLKKEKAAVYGDASRPMSKGKRGS